MKLIKRPPLTRELIRQRLAELNALGLIKRPKYLKYVVLGKDKI